MHNLWDIKWYHQFIITGNCHFLKQKSEICIVNGAETKWFSDDIFKCIYLNTNLRILIKLSLKFIPKGPIDNKSSLVKLIAYPTPSHYLNESRHRLPTHICITRSQLIMRLPKACSKDWFHHTQRWKKMLRNVHQRKLYKHRYCLVKNLK